MEPTKAQSEKLFGVLGRCLDLRNRLVADRAANRAANREARRAGASKGEFHYLDRADQYRAASLYARNDPRLAGLHSQVRQDVAHRVDEGYRRWLEACAEGRPGVRPPHLLETKKYRSFTYPQYGNGVHIKHGKVFLSGLGEFRIRDYRRVRGLKKTVTVKWAQGRWWCIVTAAIQEKDQVSLTPPAACLRDPRPDAGCDPGLTALLTDSHGRLYDPPRAYREGEAALRRAQRDMSRKFEARKARHAKLSARLKAAGEPVPPLKEMPYSNRLKREIRRVARLHTRFESVRDHHQKKIAAILASRYRRVGVEEHGVLFMTGNRRTAKAACGPGHRRAEAEDPLEAGAALPGHGEPAPGDRRQQSELPVR